MRKIDIKKFNRKKIIIMAIIFIIIFLLIVLISLYIAEKNVRDWVDVHILQKNITESDAEMISLNADKSNQVCVYSKYIAISNDKVVTLYNSYGEKIDSINTDINNAIYDSSDRYLAIAEKDGKKACLLLEKTYLWGINTDSDILQIHVNKNGYVAIITTDVTHKSILTLYDSNGKKLFTSYFSSTRIIDASISNDNKFIAIGELDSSGVTIKSNIKIISVENAQNDPDNTIIYTYNADSEKLITNVKYQDNNQIACIYDDSVNIIENENNNEILNIDKEKIIHITNNLKNQIVYVEEQSEGLFQLSSNLHIVNTSSNQENVFSIEETIKQIYANKTIIVANTGTDLYFISTNGWLIKKYTASQEITNVAFSENVAAVIFKDKIEVIAL